MQEMKKIATLTAADAARRHLLSTAELARMGLSPTADPIGKGALPDGTAVFYYHPDKVKATVRRVILKPKPEIKPLPEGEPQRISARRAESLGYFSKEVLARMYYEPTEPPIAYYIRRSGERVDVYRRATCRRLPLPCVICGAARYRAKMCRNCYEKELAKKRAEGDAHRAAHYGFTREEVLYFDMEMTGVYEHDEVLSVSIVNGTGEVVFHSLVRPVKKKKWKRTEEIHGITPEMVQDAPTFEELKPVLFPTFMNAKRLVAYGTSTDFIHLRRLCRTGSERKAMHAKLLDCAAEFSRYVKEHEIEMNHQSLSDAMAHFGLTWEGVAHNSLADTHACRLVFQTLFPNLYESEAT